MQKIRLRRNRVAAWMRNLIAQTTLSPSDFILPIFVIEGEKKQELIPALFDVHRLSIDLAIEKAKEARDLGICAIMLFPVTPQNLKDEKGNEALNKNNLICRAIKEIKKRVPEIGIIADVALDPYTSHGHDGLIDKNSYVLNDETVEILCQQALLQARAGCDIIAPSDMMDGRVAAIRKTLDENGFVNVAIMSYSAKYASSLYGPFREAVGSSANLKSDKKTYQMDFRNSSEAMREIELDVLEGADSIIIKPAINYLDIIARANDKFNLPIIAYHVSGEYSMLKLAAREGLINFDAAYKEALISIKRAGASSIITYGAIDFVKKLNLI
jgi:porphobilinogen synthase